MLEDKSAATSVILGGVTISGSPGSGGKNHPFAPAGFVIQRQGGGLQIRRERFPANLVEPYFI
ncbi:MAG: hypothetical protein AAB658_16320 [Chloroflexota bacterium]